MKFRQISSSVEDDGATHSRSGSMECDPEMAPPDAANAAILITAPDGDPEEKERPQHVNEKEKVSNSVKTNPTTVLPKVNKMTAAHWKQLISLRKRGMIPLSSTDSVKGKSLKKKMQRATSSTSTSDEQEDTPTVSVSGKGTKRKHRGIVAPTSGGREYWRYSLDIDMVYEDFNVHSSKRMYSCDFNWEHHGYSCLSRYYPGIEKKMDAVFRRAATMTDGSINSIEADTEKFRSAIRHYALVLFGVNNDAYEYRYVNIFLPIELKVFIKKLACWPHTVTIENVRHMGVQLAEREKIHIAILVLEAKKQAALLFALRAVKRYMQSN